MGTSAHGFPLHCRPPRHRLAGSSIDDRICVWTAGFLIGICHCPLHTTSLIECNLQQPPLQKPLIVAVMEVEHNVGARLLSSTFAWPSEAFLFRAEYSDSRQPNAAIALPFVGNVFAIVLERY